MPHKLVLPALGITLALLCAVIAGASSVALEEADLTGTGVAYELNRGDGGDLYLSDETAGEIWHIDAASGDYTIYRVFNPVLDAKPDAEGDLWFTDGASGFGRIDVSADSLTLWDVPYETELHNLWGLAFDEAGRVWMPEWFGFKLYSFDLAASQLCTYTLPAGGSSYSYYVLHDAGSLWLGNYQQHRIYRVDPTSNQATWWQKTGVDLAPVGLAMDGAGNLWWADAGLGALVHLEPALNRMTTFPLPVGSIPRQIEIRADGVWYTESVSGTVGRLDPSSATGTTTILDRSTGSVTSDCLAGWPSGGPYGVPTPSGQLSWQAGSVTTIVDGGGWTVNQLATGANPYGIADSSGYLWVVEQGRQKLARLTAPLPAIDLEKHTNGEDADDAPGPSIGVGEPVTWTYLLENTGNVELTAVTVTDDNGTPSDSSDDYTCDVGSLAARAVDDSCSQSGVAQAGQYANTATAEGQYEGEPVEDSDASHHFGFAYEGAISIQKRTNGEDADDAPGPTVGVGEPVTWTYVVENIGNVELTAVTVTDDNGTPSDSSDDYTCDIGSLAAGAVDDSCSQSGVAQAGQYGNTATAEGQYEGEPVEDSDASHYLGANRVYLPLVVRH